jgi:heme/copper-type cytochrome/quinol oxidase subunit 4
MSIGIAGLSLCWKYHLEEIMGLVLVAAVAGLYSLMFAVSERNRGWLIAACLFFATSTVLVVVSPQDDSATVRSVADERQRCK